MGLVEYCDNVNCLFNRKFRCTAEEVVFDEYGACSTARYNDTGDAPDEPGVDSSESSGHDGHIQHMQDDKWIKYI